MAVGVEELSLSMTWSYSSSGGDSECGSRRTIELLKRNDRTD
jgi:hypothetical protein